jgi:hypothetical protein
MKEQNIIYIYILVVGFCLLPAISRSQIISDDKSKISKPKVTDVYRLEQSCIEQSREYFSEEYGKNFEVVDQQFIWNSYTHHYNKKMDICFILTVKKIEVATEDVSISYSKLTDINDRILYGYLVLDKDKLNCYVSGNVCKSRWEWDKLIKPYMEE